VRPYPFKAFAKLCGDYSKLDGGMVLYALEAMTGDRVAHYRLNDATLTFQKVRERERTHSPKKKVNHHHNKCPKRGPKRGRTLDYSEGGKRMAMP
jgi:hypothetical protein